MNRARLLAAVIAGLALATFPFLRYAGGRMHRGPHMDHTAHYGGLLGMSGDHHVELLRREGRVEVFVSDAERRPLAVSSGRITFDGLGVMPLLKSDDRLVGDDVISARDVEVRADLANGNTVTMGFVFSD